MTLMERLRRRKNGMQRKPKVYVASLGLWILLQVISVILRICVGLIKVIMSVPMPDLSPQAIWQFLRKIHFVSFFGTLKSSLGSMIDLRGWGYALGRLSSVSEVYRNLNGRLCELIRRKWAALKKLWAEIRSPGEISRRIKTFLHQHTRNIRLVRRGIVSTILGVFLVKVLTVVYFIVLGPITLLSFLGLNCMIVLLAVINFIATQVAGLLAHIIDRRIAQASLGTLFRFRKSG